MSGSSSGHEAEKTVSLKNDLKSSSSSISIKNNSVTNLNKLNETNIKKSIEKLSKNNQDSTKKSSTDTNK